MKLKGMSQLLVFCLMVIAFVVACCVPNGTSPWLLISFYWLVLTVKNAVDFMVVRKEGCRDQYDNQE